MFPIYKSRGASYWNGFNESECLLIKQNVNALENIVRIEMDDLQLNETGINV